MWHPTRCFRRFQSLGPSVHRPRSRMQCLLFFFAVYCLESHVNKFCVVVWLWYIDIDIDMYMYIYIYICIATPSPLRL